MFVTGTVAVSGKRSVGVANVDATAATAAAIAIAPSVTGAGCIGKFGSKDDDNRNDDAMWRLE